MRPTGTVFGARQRRGLRGTDGSTPDQTTVDQRQGHREMDPGADWSDL